jgi:hypothetical protein
VVALSLNGHRLPLPPEVAQLVRALRDQRQKSWHLDQSASTTPWLFPGQEPARPLGATYLYLKLRRHGIAPLASRNSARLALATDLPASVLADFTATSISTSPAGLGTPSGTGSTTSPAASNADHLCRLRAHPHAEPGTTPTRPSVQSRRLFCVTTIR